MNGKQKTVTTVGGVTIGTLLALVGYALATEQKHGLIETNAADIVEMKQDDARIKDDIVEIRKEEADTNARLAVVEGKVKHIDETIVRVEAAATKSIERVEKKLDAYIVDQKLMARDQRVINKSMTDTMEEILTAVRKGQK